MSLHTIRGVAIDIHGVPGETAVLHCSCGSDHVMHPTGAYVDGERVYTAYCRYGYGIRIVNAEGIDLD